MHGGVVSRNTTPLSHHLLITQKPYLSESPFLDNKWDKWLKGKSRTSPYLQIKSVTKKQIKKDIADIQVPVRIRTKNFRTKSHYQNHNTITTEPKRFLSNAVIRYSI